MSRDQTSTTTYQGFEAEIDSDHYLARVLGTSAVQHRLGMENDWEKTLARLSGNSVSDSPSATSLSSSDLTYNVRRGSSQVEIQDAVSSLNLLLGRMDLHNDSQIQSQSQSHRRRRRLAGVRMGEGEGGGEVTVAGEQEDWVRMDSTVRKRKKKINKHKYKKRRKVGGFSLSFTSLFVRLLLQLPASCVAEAFTDMTNMDEDVADHK